MRRLKDKANSECIEGIMMACLYERGREKRGCWKVRIGVCRRPRRRSLRFKVGPAIQIKLSAPIVAVDRLSLAVNQNIMSLFSLPVYFELEGMKAWKRASEPVKLVRSVHSAMSSQLLRERKNLLRKSIKKELSPLSKEDIAIQCWSRRSSTFARS